MEITPQIKERLEKLSIKYNAMGQDMLSYLDGLLYADYLTYWDYIRIDTLLSLQNARTGFKDETVFIIYHQITELYFKLCIHELEQISEQENLTLDFFKTKLLRVIRYFRNLVRSFDIMVEGMEYDQFLKFRMSLLPASGFQSVQYRKIEIMSTDFKRLTAKDKQADFEHGDRSIQEMYEFIYWKAGATELSTGKKTLTLKQFENKYSAELIALGNKMKTQNLWQRYKSFSDQDQNDQSVLELLKEYDTLVNIQWPLVHYKSAVRYLQKSPEDIAATGGTNWQKYLPPRFQRRIFYPEIWTQDELNHWGKTLKDF